MSSNSQGQPDAAAIAREIRAQEAAEKKAKETEDAKKAGQGCLVLVGIIVLIGIVVFIWSSNSGSNSSSQEVITLPNGNAITSSEAVVRCRDVIRAQLLSPSSAKFPGPFSDRYTRPVRSGNTWRYVVHLDAQNAFGVMLPSSWNCVLDGNTGEIGVVQR